MKTKQLKNIQNYINVTDYIIMKRTEINGFNTDIWINSGNIKKLYNITLNELRKILDDMKTRNIVPRYTWDNNKLHKTTTIEDYKEEPWNYYSLSKGKTMSITIINSSTEKLLYYKKILSKQITK